MKLSVGIDEAGRGCVIGPLVIACVVAYDRDRRWFCSKNIRDSKVVPADERTRLALGIRERCWFGLAIAQPPDIDRAVRDRSRTLNGLELELMARLLRTAQEAFDEHELHACVDAPSSNAQGFREALYMASQWDAMDRLVAKHHADVVDRTVAAASILAKYERERLLDGLKQQLGVDFGCGYPHDRVTRRFLETCPKEASYVRWSWKTTNMTASAAP